MQVTRSAEVTVKINAEEGAGEIVKKITNKSISVNVKSQDSARVPFFIANKDTARGIFTLKLNFTNP